MSSVALLSLTAAMEQASALLQSDSPAKLSLYVQCFEDYRRLLKGIPWLAPHQDSAILLGGLSWLHHVVEPNRHWLLSLLCDTIAKLRMSFSEAKANWVAIALDSIDVGTYFSLLPVSSYPISLLPIARSMHSLLPQEVDRTIWLCFLGELREVLSQPCKVVDYSEFPMSLAMVLLAGPNPTFSDSYTHFPSR